MPRFLIFALCLFFVSCFGSTKENLKNLKTCKFTLIDVGVVLKQNPTMILIPKILLYPKLLVENPNPSKVELYDFDLDLHLLSGGMSPEYLGKVTNPEPIAIGANESKEVILNLDLEQKNGISDTMLRLVKRVLEARATGAPIEVEISGTVQIDTLFGKLPIPFQEKSSLKWK